MKSEITRGRLIKVIPAVLFFLLASIALSAHAADTSVSPLSIDVNNKRSLVNIGSIDSTNLTPSGIKAGKLLLTYLKTKDAKYAHEADALYTKIIPLENYGGEYTALQWLIKCALLPRQERDKFIKNEYERSFYNFFAKGDYAQLKEYLTRKYKLGTNPKDKDPDWGAKRRAFLEDFILFNNPRREEWEKSSEMVESLGLKPGETVADIGSGPGYFSFKFAKLVGDTGRVYAIDTVKEHLDYINSFDAKYGIKDIKTVLNEDHTIGLKGKQVDVEWICSLYHIIYVAYDEKARADFVDSLKESLKPDGTLYIVDNGLVPEGVLPYHGPYIDKDLIIGQLQAYGFRLVKDYQFVPQRYILVFKKA